MLILSSISHILQKIQRSVARSPAYFTIAAGVFLWCAAIVTVPLAGAAGIHSVDGGYAFFSHVCHQFDSRTLHIAGYPMAVCARCSAIYLGFFIGVLLSPTLSRRLRLAPGWSWAIAVVPMLFDVGADTLGIHPSDFLTRLSSGGFFGVIAALILTPLLVMTCSHMYNHSRNFLKASHEHKT
jgi:uncharacterized membrane protein